MSLLGVLSMLAVAVALMLALPQSVVGEGDELEAEDWADDDERP